MIDNLFATKKKYLRDFTISCTIKVNEFDKVLHDLGENINLMPLLIFKKLVLRYANGYTI